MEDTDYLRHHVGFETMSLVWCLDHIHLREGAIGLEGTGKIRMS